MHCACKCIVLVRSVARKAKYLGIKTLCPAQNHRIMLTITISVVSSHDYDIEDETLETTSKDGSEGDLSYAVEEEFLENTDEFIAYTDEPLADDSWVEEYIQGQEEYTQEMEELSLRLNGQTPVISW